MNTTHNVLPINVVFQRYLDLYRTNYSFTAGDVQKFYIDSTLWNFYQKDTSVAYNILITPHINCIPSQLSRADILTNKILVLVVYFDDVNYYRQRNPERKAYSMHLNPFLDQFHCDIKNCFTNPIQRSNLNILRYNSHAKPELVEAFVQACNILKRNL